MFDGSYGLFLIALGTTLAGGLALAYALAAVYAIVTFTHWMADRRVRGVEPVEPSSHHLDALGSTVTGEFLSAGALFALHPVGMIDPPTPSERILQGGRPILLVHGFMQTRAHFALLGPRLAAYGLGPIYTINLRASEGGLRDQAELLSRRINQIRLATGAQQLDVVAHSTGGLVARLAELGRREPRLRRIVTLGTPHHGTQVAHVVFGAAARDMRPHSDLVRSLAPPPPGQLVSISSTHDFFVIPPESARVAPHGRDVIVRHVGHLALLTDLQVSVEVAKALGEDILVRRPQDIFEPVETAKPKLVASAMTENRRRRVAKV